MTQISLGKYYRLAFFKVQRELYVIKKNLFLWCKTSYVLKNQWVCYAASNRLKPTQRICCIHELKCIWQIQHPFPTTFSKCGIKQKFRGPMSRTKGGFKEEEWRGFYNACNMSIGTKCWWVGRYKWVRGWRWGSGETKSKLSIFKMAIRKLVNLYANYK